MQFSYFACGCALRLYPQRKPALYKVEQRHAIHCDGIVHCVVADQRDGVHRAVNICECPHGVGASAAVQPSGRRPDIVTIIS